MTFLMWTMIIVSFVGTIINFLLILTTLRASFKTIDHLDEINKEIDLLKERKADRQKFQQFPQSVPLERM